VREKKKKKANLQHGLYLQVSTSCRSVVVLGGGLDLQAVVVADLQAVVVAGSAGASTGTRATPTRWRGDWTPGERNKDADVGALPAGLLQPATKPYNRPRRRFGAEKREMEERRRPSQAWCGDRGIFYF
jgi:hypothetical protein